MNPDTPDPAAAARDAGTRPAPTDEADLRRQARAWTEAVRRERRDRAARISRFATLSLLTGAAVLGGLLVAWVLGLLRSADTAFLVAILAGGTFLVGGSRSGRLAWAAATSRADPPDDEDGDRPPAADLDPD